MSFPPPGQFDFSQQRRTFRLELLRSLPQGFVETAMTTFAIYVAIRMFGLPPWMKSAIIASGSFGLLLSLFVVQLIRRRGWSVNNVAAVFWVLAAAGFGVAAASARQPALYCAGTCLAFVGLASAPPLMAQIYRKHYEDENRAFAKLLGIWMLIGFGNLMSFALFVEFIGNPAYGFGFDAKLSGFVTSTLPMAAFIVTVVPWGIVFDKLPFYQVRAMVNLFFIAGILVYFLGGSLLTLGTLLIVPEIRAEFRARPNALKH